ncbi:hypothetical protein [Scytonema sp. HK-05]|uniref:hypothetical protein n=1 Tax=Scytonema sp. HK-05 TaxID=1137095 RepID=UPI001E478FC5|nr:hypothetical protein [Scytonema sp. HK-05]
MSSNNLLTAALVFTQMIELSNKLFGVQPNIFYRVLFWIICGKANTSNFPLLNIQTLIYGI